MTSPDAEPAWKFWRIRAGYLEGISFSSRVRQRWGPGVTTASTPCSVDPAHEAPAPDCMCGLYVLPDPPIAVAYLGRTTLGRQPSTPVAVGAVRPIGPRLPARPWPLGDPKSTLRVGAAEIAGPLHVFPGTDAMRDHVEQTYGVPVVAATAPDFREWLDRLAAEAA